MASEVITGSCRHSKATSSGSMQLSQKHCARRQTGANTSRPAELRPAITPTTMCSDAGRAGSMNSRGKAPQVPPKPRQTQPMTCR